MNAIIPVCNADLIQRIAAESGARVDDLRLSLEAINQEQREAKRLSDRQQRRFQKDEVPRCHTYQVSRQANVHGSCTMRLRETRTAQQLVIHHSDDGESAEVSRCSSDSSTSGESFDSEEMAKDYQAVAEGIEDSPERYLNSESDQSWSATSDDVSSSNSSVSSHPSIEAEDAIWQQEQERATEIVVAARANKTAERTAQFSICLESMRQERAEILADKEEWFRRASRPLPLPPVQSNPAILAENSKKRKKMEKVRSRKKPTRYNTTVADLLSAGLLKAGQGVLLYDVKKANIKIDLLDTGKMRVREKTFSSPSMLAQFLSGRASGGYTDLKYQGHTLDYYRRGLELSKSASAKDK